MRIAVFHNLPSGGAKRTLYEQIRRLSSDCDIDVFTLTCADHTFADLRVWVGEHFVGGFTPLPLMASPFGRANQLARLVDLMRLAQVGKSIAARIDRQSYDVAYVEPCRYSNSPAILRYLRTASVFYCHEPLRLVHDAPVGRRAPSRTVFQRGLDSVDPLPAVYKAALAREDNWNMQAATHVLANSRFSRERIGQVYGRFPHVCYHGVDVDAFRPLGLPQQGYVISVGALRPNKGFDFVIRSLALVPASRRPRLVIVSNFQSASESSYLLRLARCMRVELEIRVLVSDADLVRLYNQAVATVYAPLQEPFGLVPLESMACGTPIVGVDEGGVRETVVQGVTGLLVDRDTASFAQAVECLLCDRPLRRRLGMQGRQYTADSWDWDTAVINLRKHLYTARERVDGKRL